MKMHVKNTKENKTVRDAVASMAVDGMYFKAEFIEKLLMVANGEKTSDELRQEVLQKYKKKGNKK